MKHSLKYALLGIPTNVEEFADKAKRKGKDVRITTVVLKNFRGYNAQLQFGTMDKDKPDYVVPTIFCEEAYPRRWHSPKDAEACFPDLEKYFPLFEEYGVNVTIFEPVFISVGS